MVVQQLLQLDKSPEIGCQISPLQVRTNGYISFQAGLGLPLVFDLRNRGKSEFLHTGKLVHFQQKTIENEKEPAL